MKLLFIAALFVSLIGHAETKIDYDKLAEDLIEKRIPTQAEGPFLPAHKYFEQITNFNLSTNQRIAEHALMVKIHHLDVILFIHSGNKRIEIQVLADPAKANTAWRINERGLIMKFAVIEAHMWANTNEEVHFSMDNNAYLVFSKDFRAIPPTGLMFRNLENGQFMLYTGFTYNMYSRTSSNFRKEVVSDLLRMINDDQNCEMLMSSEGLRDSAEERIRKK